MDLLALVGQIQALPGPDAEVEMGLLVLVGQIRAEEEVLKFAQVRCWPPCSAIVMI